MVWPFKMKTESVHLATFLGNMSVFRPGGRTAAALLHVCYSDFWSGRRLVSLSNSYSDGSALPPLFGAVYISMMPSKPTANANSLEAPADFVGLAFPGRSTLYVHEVAGFLSVSETQIRDLIVEGKLQGFNVGNSSRKSWRVPLAALRQFLQQSSSPVS